ncbi:hypothetical protein LTR78_008725 [Recurvomyces mirabilis]|uniref:Heterokaryon incompatibility domain-containing protein n=1 Tax=Recurvomyces mirabilis TaxID=574656 RepID=A0AAE0TSY8_9PEZI|nr:hypothetical protein LTR78_008725 [Recurvomyces mirabilis]KAK5159190.1 hypothetical protein LTS14_002332 [Recurvomyces mirabilis]
MSEIYRHANSVTIWLVKPGRLMDARRVLAKLSRWQNLVTPGSSLVSDAHHKQGLMEAALASTSPCWLDRAWVLQEVVSNSNIHICFGRHRLIYGGIWSSRDYVPGGSPHQLTRRLYEKLTSLQQLYRSGTIADLVEGRRYNSFYEAARLAITVTSTDPRDKVYSLLGLVGAKEAAKIRPDYTLPIWTVFAQATYASIAHTRQLDMLELVRWHDTKVQDLTQAVRTPEQGRTRHSEGLRSFTEFLDGRDNGVIRLTGRWEPWISTDWRQLHLRGAKLDMVRTGTGFPADGRVPFETLLYATCQLLASHRPLSDRTSGDQGLPDIKFDRSILRTRSEEIVHRDDKYALRDILECLKLWDGAASLAEETNWMSKLVVASNGHIHRLVEEHDEETPSVDEFRYSRLFEHTEDVYRPYPGEENDDDERRFLFWWYTHYADYVAGQLTLFCTTRGYLGLAPGEVIGGDQLCLVHGACLPVLLRPAPDGTWTFRGFSYIHGIGKGQLVDFVPGLGYREEELVIC